MEGVMETEGTDPATAGNTGATPDTTKPGTEEKLLPPGKETVVMRTPRASAMPLVSPAMLQSFSKMPDGIVLSEAERYESGAEEKPTSLPVQKSGNSPSTPPILHAADMLHMGNAVVAANANEPAVPIAPAPEEAPIERNLREVGLKEALPHPDRKAPERSVLPETETPEGQRRIRTYADDMGKEIQKRGATISSIITAEKIRGPVDAPIAEKKTHPNLWILGAAFLVILGIGAIVTAYFLIGNSGGTAAPPQSIIPVNHRTTVSVSNNVLLVAALTRAKGNSNQNLGEITELDIQKDGVPLSAADVLIALNAPNELARNATGIFVGLHAGNYTQPVILITVSAYDHAFRAMLDWEKTMGENLGDFFAPANVTPGRITTHAPSLTFTDRVGANLDVRGSQTEWPILYTFPRQDLLIITTNESTLREVLTRLVLQKSSSQ